MKRVLVASMVGLILALTLGASAALAAEAPDSLTIFAGAGGPPMTDHGETDGAPPPEITITLPNGDKFQPGPPDSYGDPGGGL